MDLLVNVISRSVQHADKMPGQSLGLLTIDNKTFAGLMSGSDNISTYFW